MPNIIRSLVVLIAFVALSPHSYAQTVGNKLEGIASVQILVEDLNDPSCGITREDILSAAAFPIATSKLSINDTSPSFFYVALTVAPTGSNGCAGGYIVQVYSIQAVRLNQTSLTKVVPIELWSGTGVVGGSKRRFKDQVRNHIENMSKKFVVDWTLDQQ